MAFSLKLAQRFFVIPIRIKVWLTTLIPDGNAIQNPATFFQAHRDTFLVCRKVLQQELRDIMLVFVIRHNENALGI